MMKKYIYLILAICSSSVDAHNYEVLASHLLPGLSSVRNRDEVISDYDRHKTAISILATGNHEKELTVRPPLSDTTISDLSLLFYDISKPEFTILNRMKRTQTTLGTCELAAMLITPLRQPTQLLARQKMLQLLINNDRLRESLRDIIGQFKKYEPQLLSLWNPEDRLYGKNMRQTFFKGDIIKSWNNKGWIEFRNRYEDVMAMFSSLFGFGILELRERILGKNAIGWKMKAAKWGMPLFGLVISVASIITNMKNRAALIDLARQRMSSLVALGTITHQLEKWTEAYPAARKNIQTLEQIFSFGDQENRDLHNFLKSLRSRSFDMKNGYINSFIGPVLSAIPTFLKLKDRLCPLLHTIAELDALTSLATLYKEHEDTDNRYTFATYLGPDDGPQLKAEGFWHPVLAPEKAVPSSLIMGGPKARRNVVLTGPNAAGKSTVSKAIMLSALLAQTATIVPAHSIRLTPFKVLNTYLNIVESHGISQHRAEVRRVRSLVDSLQSLKGDEFGLTIMDEMLRLTDPDVGAAAALGVGTVLGDNKRSLLILATHFANLTTLADLSPSHYNNYRVSAIKNNDGSFSFPYRLEKGINDKVIALDLLAHEGFDPNILNFAFDHLADIQKAEQPAEQTAALQAFIEKLRQRVGSN